MGDKALNKTAAEINAILLAHKVTGLDETGVNIVHGHSGNAIASDVRASTINGGGQSNYENVIGAASSNNVNTANSNLPVATGTDASYCAILGGYDNVNNGLASFIAGQHCIIEKEATHGTIMGGSSHKIADGAYGTISGGTGNNIVDGVNAVISGGKANIANGNNTTVGGGEGNKALAIGAVVCGGVSNDVNNTYGTIAGGNQNIVTSNYGAVGGGILNKITAGLNGYIGGGSTNEVSGNYACIMGGTNNKASGSNSLVLGGGNNLSSGIGSAVLGGSYNQATADYSIAKGNYAEATRKGEEAFANGRFSASGDAQSLRSILRIITTDATATLIGISGAAIAPSIPENTTWLYKARVVARRTDVEGDTAAFTMEGCVSRNTGGNIANIGTPTITTIGATAGAAAWSIALVLGSSTFNVKATGEADKTIRWVMELDIIQVKGA